LTISALSAFSCVSGAPVLDDEILICTFFWELSACGISLANLGLYFSALSITFFTGDAPVSCSTDFLSDLCGSRLCSTVSSVISLTLSGLYCSFLTKS
jgi:hypothetical protein